MMVFVGSAAVCGSKQWTPLHNLKRNLRGATAVIYTTCLHVITLYKLYSFLVSYMCVSCHVM